MFPESWNGLTAWLSSCWRTLQSSPHARRTALLLAVFALALVWAYAPALAEMARCWSNDPKYSHGFLVPVFAGIVLWTRRAAHPDVQPRLSWEGVPWQAAAAVMRLVSAGF